MNAAMVQSVVGASTGRSSRAELRVKGEGAFAALGVEVGSLGSFFSSEREGAGAPRRTFDWNVHADGSVWRMDAVVDLEGTVVEIQERGSVAASEGFRRLRVSAHSDALLMDAVLRFVIPLERVESVLIGPEAIPHRAANRYHQRAMQPVTLLTRSGRTVRFVPSSENLPRGMAPVVYVRDERRHWVLHVRALATEPSATVLKGCHRLYDKALPNHIQAVARSIPGLLRRTLYVRERVSQRIPFQTNGAVRLPRGNAFEIGVEWEWT